MAQITLGAGFLNPNKKELGVEMLKVLQRHNIKNIDTSRVYVCSILELFTSRLRLTRCGFKGGRGERGIPWLDRSRKELLDHD